MAGLELDPWQQFVILITRSASERRKWAAFEVGLEVPRQNGKGAILEARELAGLFLLGERLIIHSAHQFDTSLEHFRRLLELIEDTPDFDRRVKRVSKVARRGGHRAQGRAADPVPHADEGRRPRLLGRLRDPGRGDDPARVARTARCCRRCRPARIRRSGTRGRRSTRDPRARRRVRARPGARPAGDDPRSRTSTSAEGDDPGQVPAAVADRPGGVGAGEPGLGIRISPEYVANERRSLAARTFAVERLGVGDWPDTSDDAGA
jgi:hypothetical protein